MRSSLTGCCSGTWAVAILRSETFDRRDFCLRLVLRFTFCICVFLMFLGSPTLLKLVETLLAHSGQGFTVVVLGRTCSAAAFRPTYVRRESAPPVSSERRPIV